MYVDTKSTLPDICIVEFQGSETMLHNSSRSSVPISQDDNQSGGEQQVLSDFRRPLKIMHLHDRPPFRLQNDDVPCNIHSIGNDSEQPPIFVDV